MVRNAVGAVLAVVGAAAALLSPFRAWYDTRLGRQYRLSELFGSGGVSGAHPNLLWSLFLPFLVTAVLTLAGVLARSRALVALAGVLALGFTVLWMVRVGQANGGSLTLDADGSGLAQGVAGAAGGGLLLLLAAAVMSGRARRRPEPATGPYAGHDAPDSPDSPANAYGEPRSPASPYREPDTPTAPLAYDADGPGHQEGHRPPPRGWENPGERR
ncbi:hypothetical protein AB0J21_05170 [Streptomyces sp. NPDC049954]|uniref:hypothetical protein n=1 Tax=Streptomyces sp. NPDC049954 TaxID=3155779 RepID=UPI003423A4DE